MSLEKIRKQDKIKKEMATNKIAYENSVKSKLAEVVNDLLDQFQSHYLEKGFVKETRSDESATLNEDGLIVSLEFDESGINPDSRNTRTASLKFKSKEVTYNYKVDLFMKILTDLERPNFESNQKMDKLDKEIAADERNNEYYKMVGSGKFSTSLDVQIYQDTQPVGTKTDRWPTLKDALQASEL